MNRSGEKAAQNGDASSVLARMIDTKAQTIILDPSTQTLTALLESLEFRGDESCNYHVFFEIAEGSTKRAIRWAYAGEHDGKVVVMEGLLDPSNDLAIGCAGVGLFRDGGNAEYLSGFRYGDTGSRPLEERELYGEVAAVRNLENVSLYQMRRETAD